MSEDVDLRPWLVAVLRALSPEFGRASAAIGEKVWPDLSRRSASGAARAACEELNRLGLVRHMDNERPIAWVLTARGEAALALEPGSATPTPAGPSAERAAPAGGDHRPDSTGLDDGPPFVTSWKLPATKSPDEMRAIRAAAWATRRAKYGARGHG